MSEMNERPQLKMKSDITRPRRACLICCTSLCCSRLHNWAYWWLPPWYDTAKAFSCGSSVRVSELSAHTKFHYRVTQGLHLWAAEKLQPMVVCNIKISAISQFWRNSHASKYQSVTNDRWCKAPQGIILKFLAHVNNGQWMKHLEIRLNLCRFRCVSCRHKSPGQ